MLVYQPVIFTDSVAPLAAGREIWGFAKLFTVERPLGKRIMTFTLSVDCQGRSKMHPVAPIENAPPCGFAGRSRSEGA